LAEHVGETFFEDPDPLAESLVLGSGVGQVGSQ
jgi:hypothetical protein